MKTLISFCMILMMVLGACNKEQFVQDEPLTLKKAKVPVPMKADFCSSPAPDAILISIPGTGIELPNKMFVSGTATHMGKVITDQSVCETKTLNLVVEGEYPDFKYFLIQTGDGVMTAANGDNYPITWWVKTSLADWTYIGEVTMYSGTGKFEGASGVVTMIGTVDRVAGTNCWKADGYIQFAR